MVGFSICSRFNVTIVSDMFSSDFETLFCESWGRTYPGRALTGSIWFCSLKVRSCTEFEQKNVHDLALLPRHLRAYEVT